MNKFYNLEDIKKFHVNSIEHAFKVDIKIYQPYN